jgi:hypothetical protein
MTTPQIVLLASGGFIFMLVWIRWRSKLKASTEDRLSRSPQAEARAEISDTARRLLLDIEDVSRQVNARLGTKMRVLDALLKEADQKIESLEQLLEKKKPSAAVIENSDESEDEPGQGASASEADKMMEEIYRLHDSGEDALSIARKVDLPRGEVELILSLRNPRE